MIMIVYAFTFRTFIQNSGQSLNGMPLVRSKLVPLYTKLIALGDLSCLYKVIQCVECDASMRILNRWIVHLKSRKLSNYWQ